MPRESTLEIVGPSGTRVALLDNNGIRIGASDSVMKVVDGQQLVAVQVDVNSVDKYVWECVEGVWNVSAVKALVSTAGGSGAQVDVKVCAGLTAPASGTTQLSAVLTLTTTGPSRSDGTLIATPTDIFPGDSVAVDMGGTLTALVGLVMIQLKRKY